MRSGASRGNWYALFPEGKGGARWWPGGFMQEGAEGRRFRRVAAVPVCPPFRNRSRGGREVGAAPPVAGGCCEAGLHRCGWRGAAVPGSYARGRRALGAWFAFPRGERARERGGTGTRFSRRGRAARARGAHHRTDVAVGHAQRRAPGAWFAFPRGERAARAGGTGTRFSRRGRAARAGGPAGLCKRAQRGGGSGGWLPCRFARHFVTGRGVAVKWGLRRRSPGVVVKRGCTAVDGGARRFRGVMREDGGGAAVPGSYARGRRGAAVSAGYARGRRGVVARRVAAVPVCPPFRDRSSGVAVKRVCVALSGCPPLVGSNGGCAADRRGLL